MKKRFFAIATSALLGLGTLTGCGSPKTSYEKVKKALDGVESSFKSVTKSVAPKRSLLNKTYVPAYASEFDDALDTIWNEWGNGDRGGSSIEDISYNEPPMMQFQCLKSVFEKIGKGYSFGTKYTADITGKVYKDMETGEEKASSQSEYEHNYTFTLSMQLDIDSNDLIRADVSFDIDVYKGETHYTSTWYVSMELDYDLSGSKPNYTMTMLTDNDESGIPFVKDKYVLEYDYVKVENNVIKEWRKFDVGSSKRLVKDATHPNFASYVNDGTEIRLGHCKFWRNGQYHKFLNLGSNRLSKVGEALFTGLNINSTAINPSAFLSKTGTQNNALNESYNDFSRVVGRDLILELIGKGEDDHGGGSGPIDQTVARIAIKTNNEQVQSFPYTVKFGVSLDQLFSSADYWEEGLYPVFVLMNSNNQEITKTNDLSLFDITATSGRNNVTMSFNKQDTTVEIFSDLYDGEVTVSFRYKENPNIPVDTLRMAASDDIFDEAQFPQAMLNHFGWTTDYYPSFPDLPAGSSFGYIDSLSALDLTKDSRTGYTAQGKGDISSYVEAFKNDLGRAGYTVDDISSQYKDTIIYSKTVDNVGKFYAYILFEYGNMADITYKFEIAKTEPPVTGTNLYSALEMIGSVLGLHEVETDIVCELNNDGIITVLSKDANIFDYFFELALVSTNENPQHSNGHRVNFGVNYADCYIVCQSPDNMMFDTLYYHGNNKTIEYIQVPGMINLIGGFNNWDEHSQYVFEDFNTYSLLQDETGIHATMHFENMVETGEIKEGQPVYEAQSVDGFEFKVCVLDSRSGTYQLGYKNLSNKDGIGKQGSDNNTIKIELPEEEQGRTWFNVKIDLCVKSDGSFTIKNLEVN